MKNQSLMVVENNIFVKIKKFFYNLKDRFFKHKEIVNEVNVEQDINENQEVENNFRKEIKIDVKDSANPTAKKDLLEELNGNIQKLELLSTDRLRKLEKYYDNVIKQNEIKIKKLNAEQ